MPWPLEHTQLNVYWAKLERHIPYIFKIFYLKCKKQSILPFFQKNPFFGIYFSSGVLIPIYLDLADLSPLFW